MWIGFALAAAVDILNGFHELYPGVPLIKVRVVHYDAYMATIFRGFPWGALGGTRISFYPFAIGIGMLLPLDLAFSCWFFFIFWKLQRVLASHIGIHGMPGFPFVEEQTAGGYYAIALMALWVTRHHFARQFRILLGRETDNVTLWERQEVGLRPRGAKHFAHPELGAMELECQTLIDPASTHTLLVYTAAPGSESYEKLELLGVIGQQSLR